MNYRVILNEQTTIYLSNIDIVRCEDETVIFRELEGNIVAAFKMYNITGFFREDGPPIAPKHEWDFDLIDKYTKKQEEEALKNARISSSDMMEATRKASQQIGKALTKVVEQQEEVFKSRAYSPQDIKYKDLFLYAEDRVEEGIVTYKMVKDQMNEVMEECFERGGIAPRGDQVPLYARSLIQAKIRQSTDEYELKYLEELLARNMEHCIHGYDVYGDKK